MALTNCTPLSLWTPRARLASVCDADTAPSLTAADTYVLWGAELGQTINIPSFEEQQYSVTDDLSVVEDIVTNVFNRQWPVLKMHISSSGGLGLYEVWPYLGDFSRNRTVQYPTSIGQWAGTLAEQALTISWTGPRGPLSRDFFSGQGGWIKYTKTLIGNYSLFLMSSYEFFAGYTEDLLLAQVAVRLQPGRVDIVCTSMVGTTTLRRHTVPLTGTIYEWEPPCEYTNLGGCFTETGVVVLGQAEEGATTAVTLTYP